MNCNLCSKPIQVEGICITCNAKTVRMLTEIETLWHQAHDELLPGKSGNGGRSSERTLGLNVVALSFIAGDDILGILHEWEKIIRAERNLTPPALVPVSVSLEAEIHDAVAFAITHLPFASLQGWFSDYFTEIRDLHSTGMSAARQFVSKARKMACPAQTTDNVCNTLLKINEDEPLAEFDCKGCGTTWTTLRLVAVAMADPDREVWLDAEAIANWLAMSERHVHRLCKQHDVPRRGQLYDFNKLQHARKVS